MGKVMYTPLYRRLKKANFHIIGLRPHTWIAYVNFATQYIIDQSEQDLGHFF